MSILTSWMKRVEPEVVIHRVRAIVVQRIFCWCAVLVVHTVVRSVLVLARLNVSAWIVEHLGEDSVRIEDEGSGIAVRGCEARSAKRKG